MKRNSSFLQTAHLRASPGAPTHMVGGIGPGDDPLQLTTWGKRSGGKYFVTAGAESLVVFSSHVEVVGKPLPDLFWTIPTER